MVLDLSNPASPALAGVYDLGIDQGQKTVDFADESGSGYTHSLTVSDDGTRAYMAGWDYGFWTLDTSMLANPPAGGVTAWASREAWRDSASRMVSASCSVNWG